MKKALLLLTVTLCLLNTVQAQTSGGPDAYGYVWRDSNDPNGPVYNWIDLTTNPEAVLVTGLADDNVSGPFGLTVPFHYYWYDVNQFWVGSNGYIGFTNGLIASNGTQGFPNMPDPLGVNNFIAAFLTDLNFGGAGNTAQCYIYQSGSGDSVVISYVDVPFWQNGVPPYTGLNSFQIILNNNDSSIVFQYLAQNGTSPGTQAVTFEVGIENNSGNIALNYLVNQLPSPGTAVKYYYPDTTSYQVNDASTAWCDNPGNAGIFLSKNGAPFNKSAEIKNSGNTSLAGFNAFAEVRTATNVLQVRDTQAVGALVAGATQLVNFADPFIPGTANLYKMNCTTLLTGDATPTNNTRTLEVNVVDTTLSLITLAYENGIEAGAGGIGWSGGDGGIAMHFTPPFYPCNLTAAQAFIVADANNVGYSILVYADDGLNGAPGTLLDSVNVAGGTFALNVFTTTSFSSPLQITSGGFYILWYMGGDGISIGQNIVTPFSFQAYEVLGGTAPGNFAFYRNIDQEDLMIRANIQKVVGIEEIKAGELFSQFYPNPAAEKAMLNYDLNAASAKQIKVELYNIAGNLVYSEMVGATSGQLEINVKNLDAGVYLCRLTAGDTQVNRKLTVIK